MPFQGGARLRRVVSNAAVVADRVGNVRIPDLVANVLDNEERASGVLCGRRYGGVHR